MLQPGTQIGRYEVQRKLARGGMGTVYVAHDPVLGRMVALKVFLGDLDVPDAHERFAREARAAASLNHTNIVTIYDFGEVDSQPYIVMEYIQGETLAEIIRRRTPVPVSEKLRWLEELCAGVASAHKMDVIHRDIKPSNLMVDRTGRLKILDFGIAKIVSSLGSSMTAVIGTPGYMAPEQLLGQPVDARTDLFAAGVVGFELLTYEEAFPGDSFTTVTHRIITEDVRRVSEVVPDVPETLSALIDKALQKDPANRFQDAESLRVALHRIRRSMESAEHDGSALTIISPMAGPPRKVGTGTSKKPAAAGARTAELTPPPDPAAEREAVAKARAAKVDASLERAEACLRSGDVPRAQAACREALTLDPQHAAALALDQRITAKLAQQRAASLLADARSELERGALTRCKSLLEEARQVDPSAHDAKLERELRLARVDQERLRHRSETANKTIAVARAALERGDVEAALACAREALTLDPNSEEARDIELAALRGLEDVTSDRPTRQADDDEEEEQDEVTIIATPRLTPSPRPAPPPVPAAASTTTATPTPAPSVATQTSAPAPSPTAPLPGSAPAPSTTSVPAPAPAVPAKARTTTPPAPVVPRPNPLLKVRDGARNLPIGPAIAKVRGATSGLVARARTLSQRQLMIVAGAAALLLGIAAVVAYLLLRTPAVAATGVVVIEATPWAQITAITGEDGVNRLAAPEPTPLSTSLPAGTYTITLSGPPPASEARTVTVDVAADGVTVSPLTRFRAPTSEEYFTKYFGGEAPATTPTDETSSPEAAPTQPSAPAPGATP